jgi:hypothetical protein
VTEGSAAGFAGKATFYRPPVDTVPGAGPSRIISCFAKDFTMEAEQRNALANTLADLSTRTRELRRYL